MKSLLDKKAPDFKMPTASGDGKDLGEVTLDDYKGGWLVMFFYPADFTFVWPTEITGFSKQFEKFDAENAKLLGVSTDSEHSHKAWINGELGKLKFPLASDRTMTVSRDYGVLVEEDGVALRGLFIIDPEGSVRYSVVHGMNVGRSVDETLRVLKALKTEGLCPIDWGEGEELL